MANPIINVALNPPVPMIWVDRDGVADNIQIVKSINDAFMAIAVGTDGVPLPSAE